MMQNIWIARTRSALAISTWMEKRLVRGCRAVEEHVGNVNAIVRTVGWQLHTGERGERWEEVERRHECVRDLAGFDHPKRRYFLD